MLRLATLIVSSTLVLAGCGGSDSESAHEPSRKTPSPSESPSSESSSPAESPSASRSATPARDAWERHPPHPPVTPGSGIRPT